MSKFAYDQRTSENISPDVEDDEDPNDTEIKAHEWQEIGKNKALQFAVLDRIMIDCEEI